MPARMIPYELERKPVGEMARRAEELFAQMQKRRSCRMFSPEPVPKPLIEKVIEIAHSAPSGANRKPWRFVAIDDPGLKHEICLAAEAEERESYGRRMPQEWLDALEPLGTNAEKPFLEIAPWLVVMFRIDWELVPRALEAPAGKPPVAPGSLAAPGAARPAAPAERVPNYYPHESAGIAAGFFIMAAHQVGLATLTHTPSPLGFLRDLLGRPANEKPFLLMPVGYPAPDCVVPDITKKPLRDALQWNRGVDTPAAGP